MKSIQRGTLLIFALLPLLSSCAQHGTHGHSDSASSHSAASSDHSASSHHSATAEHAPKPVAKSYADAVTQMQTRMASLDTIVKSGKYDDVHDDSEAIRDLCAMIGNLAAAEGSPVPREKVKEVTDLAAQLSSAARKFHSAAHDEDLPQVRDQYAQMNRLITSLAQYGSSR